MSLLIFPRIKFTDGVRGRINILYNAPPPSCKNYNYLFGGYRKMRYPYSDFEWSDCFVLLAKKNFAWGFHAPLLTGVGCSKEYREFCFSAFRSDVLDYFPQNEYPAMVWQALPFKKGLY